MPFGLDGVNAHWAVKGITGAAPIAKALDTYLPAVNLFAAAAMAPVGATPWSRATVTALSGAAIQDSL
jgi:hypothetical protein